MFFCGNCKHDKLITELEQSILTKNSQIQELFMKDGSHDNKLRKHEDMINSLTECVNSIKQTNKELKEYHDKNSKYFETIIDNMITVNVFTRNIKWLTGIIVAFGVIWKMVETFYKY